jgi:dipeptidyl aminopeptidase/acylaminoacyl peptidase
MIRNWLAALAALALLPGAAAPAGAPPAPAVDPAARFGARPGIEDISLSPSGSKVAFIAPGPGQSTILFTVDAAGGSQPRQALAADGKPERLTHCFWVSEDRLVCKIYFVVQMAGDVASFTRFMAVDADGSHPRILSRPSRAYDAYVAASGGAVIDALPGEDGAVLMGQIYVPEQRQGTHLNDERQGFGVERIDTRNGSSRVIEQPKRDAVEYISDGRGTVRILGSRSPDATGYASSTINYYYRKKGSRDWQGLSDYNVLTDEGFNPYAVDPDLDVAYGFKRVNGRLALYSVALDGSKRETLVYAHPEVDVDDLVRIGRNERVVGVTYATEKRQAVYFDPQLQALGRSLSKALPGLPLVRFVDSSLDESKLLILASSDNDAGRYYIFDKAAKRLNEIVLARPDLEGVALAQVKPVTFKAGDGTQVPAYLTLPPGSDGRNLPAIVMPHGGPSARDEWGFDWLAQYFASRGYAVLQPNYRGSTGYGDAWFQTNGFRSWRTAIGDVDDAGRWLVAQGIADPKKLAIFGWSYGGYAALQSGVLDPGLFRAVVAVAPVTDLAQLKQEGWNWYYGRIQNDFIGSGPHISEGSPAQNAARLQAPVLIFHGDRDLNVPIQQSRMMADRLKDAGKKVELIVYPNLDHQLADSQARADMLRRSDAFFRAAFGI